jgi:leucine dehydrogenase
MDIFEMLADGDHEQLVYCHEPSSGYRGLIAIHNTTLGPALGGTRYWHYKSESDAVIDALRLSRGMTYKAAVAGLSLGGGKSVVMADHGSPDREAIFRAHGRFIESLKGRYITAEDVGTSPADKDHIHLETEHVVGLQGRSGDPSPVTPGESKPSSSMVTPSLAIMRDRSRTLSSSISAPNSATGTAS